MQRVQNSGANLNGRILLIDEQSGDILADSDNQLIGRNLFQLGAVDRLNNTLLGEFQLDGVRWLWSSRQGIDRTITAPEVVDRRRIRSQPLRLAIRSSVNSCSQC